MVSAKVLPLLFLVLFVGNIFACHETETCVKSEPKLSETIDAVDECQIHDFCVYYDPTPPYAPSQPEIFPDDLCYEELSQRLPGEVVKVDAFIVATADAPHNDEVPTLRPLKNYLEYPSVQESQDCEDTSQNQKSTMEKPTQKDFTSRSSKCNPIEPKCLNEPKTRDSLENIFSPVCDIEDSKVKSKSDNPSKPPIIAY